MHLPRDTMNLLSTFALLLALAGCSGSSGMSVQSHKRSSFELPIGVTVRFDSSTLSYTVIVDPVDASRLKRASQLTLLVFRANSTDEFPMSMTSMGAPGRSETVTTMITGSFSSAALRGYDSLGIVAQLDGENVHYGVEPKTAQDVSHYDISHDPADTFAVKLLVSYRRNADSTITFTARALRQRAVEGEYFPSSEHLRLRLINGKGQIVWASNVGMAFLTMVSSVEPTVAGGFHDYTADWNGMADDGLPPPAGTYRLEVLLPVKPLAYATIVELRLPLP